MSSGCEGLSRLVSLLRCFIEAVCPGTRSAERPDAVFDGPPAPAERGADETGGGMYWGRVRCAGLSLTGSRRALGYLVPHADPRTDREGVEGAGRSGGDDSLPAEGQELKRLVVGLYSDVIVGGRNEAFVADYGLQLVLPLLYRRIVIVSVDDMGICVIETTAPRTDQSRHPHWPHAQPQKPSLIRRPGVTCGEGRLQRIWAQLS